MNKYRLTVCLAVLFMTGAGGVMAEVNESSSGPGSFFANRPFLRAYNSLTGGNSSSVSKESAKTSSPVSRQNNAESSAGRQAGNSRQQFFRPLAPQQESSPSSRIQKRHSGQPQQAPTPVQEPVNIKQKNQTVQNVPRFGQSSFTPPAPPNVQNQSRPFFQWGKPRQNNAQQSAMAQPRVSQPGMQTAERQSIGRQQAVRHPGIQSAGQHPGTAAQSFDEVMKPTTSKAAAMEAVNKIPWNRLTPDSYKKAESVVSAYSVFRRLPLAGGNCNPEIFDYCIVHPDVVVGFWEHLGNTQISIRQSVPNYFQLKDNSGTNGQIEILYQDSENVLAYCYGTYQGGVANRVLEGEILLYLQIRYSEDDKRQPIVVCRADSFVKINNVGAEIVGKVLAPVLGKVSDANFQQTVSFICSLSDMAEKTPKDVYTLIDGLTNRVAPEVQEGMYETVASVWSEARERSEGAIVDYRLTPKKDEPQESFARIINRKLPTGVQEEDLANGSVPQHTSSATGTEMEGIRLLDQLPSEADLAKESRKALNKQTRTSNDAVEKDSVEIEFNEDKKPSVTKSSTESEKIDLPEVPSLPTGKTQLPGKRSVPVGSAGNAAVKRNGTVLGTNRALASEMAIGAEEEDFTIVDDSVSESSNEIQPLSSEPGIGSNGKILPAVPFKESMFNKPTYTVEEKTIAPKGSNSSVIERKIESKSISKLPILPGAKETADEIVLLDESESAKVPKNEQVKEDVKTVPLSQKRTALPVLTFDDSDKQKEVESVDTKIKKETGFQPVKTGEANRTKIETAKVDSGKEEKRSGYFKAAKPVVSKETKTTKEKLVDKEELSSDSWRVVR